jgi:hypothetical protein
MRKKAKSLKKYIVANGSNLAGVIIQGVEPKYYKMSLNLDTFQIELIFEDVDTFYLIERNVKDFLAGYGIKSKEKDDTSRDITI